MCGRGAADLRAHNRRGGARGGETRAAGHCGRARDLERESHRPAGEIGRVRCGHRGAARAAACILRRPEEGLAGDPHEYRRRDVQPQGGCAQRAEAHLSPDAETP